MPIVRRSVNCTEVKNIGKSTGKIVRQNVGELKRYFTLRPDVRLSDISNEAFTIPLPHSLFTITKI